VYTRNRYSANTEEIGVGLGKIGSDWASLAEVMALAPCAWLRSTTYDEQRAVAQEKKNGVGVDFPTHVSEREHQWQVS
jgi:hypothetical protein